MLDTNIIAKPSFRVPASAECFIMKRSVEMQGHNQPLRWQPTQK